MSDLTTLTQHIVRELHLDTSSTGTQATNDVKRAIIDSMKFMETECPWFLVTEYTIPLVQDVYRYALPTDYESIDQSIFFIPLLTEPKVKWPIRLVPLEHVKSRLSTGFEWESTVDQGDPSVVAVDTASMELVVAPTPDSTLSGLEVRIFRRGDIPWYKYDGSTWVYYNQGTNTALATGFTNRWIQEAYGPLFNYSIHLLMNGAYAGSATTENRANSYLVKYTQEINKLRGKSTRSGQVTYIPRHI